MPRVWKAVRHILMIPPNLVTAFLEKANADGYRSTVLRPLGWLLGLCTAGAISSASIPHGPAWLTVMFGIGAGASTATYLASFVYCLIKIPENLRTESYSIQRLAIEKGFRGDSLTGVITSQQVLPGQRTIQSAGGDEATGSE
jgi:hypothetical protein